jgi:hypothetical protein
MQLFVFLLSTLSAFFAIAFLIKSLTSNEEKDIRNYRNLTYVSLIVFLVTGLFIIFVLKV